MAGKNGHRKFVFTWNGIPGAIAVEWRINRGAEFSGFDALNASLAKWEVRGFPTMRASISYAGRGYAGYFGFIQIVTCNYQDRCASQPFVDVFPAMKGVNTPFAAFGYLPRFYDAPAWENRKAMTFVAECYLCRPSLMDRKDPIRCVKGFRWGFEITKDGGSPKILPLVSLSPAQWAQRLPLLRKRYPRWKFAP